jgi:DNA-binding NtrC family response regulator
MPGPESRAKEHILVTDDDGAFRLATRTVLEDEGYTVSLADGIKGALDVLSSQRFDLLLSDLVMGSGSGIELLRNVRRQWPDLPVIMVTGFGSIQTAVEAMRLGAADYLAKPSNNDELLIKIRRALDRNRQERELRSLRDVVQTRFGIGGLVARSNAMKNVITQIQQVADTDVTVLILGASGTGKELVARALHFNGSRKSNPFVAVNCAALPEQLLESELFGHEKGAFTGADRQRAGKFEEAHTGTLFMDEIGEMSAALQGKLLRVLQEKSFQRVGGGKTVTVDTRVVTATSRNLDVMVAAGDFREDLYYRLNVFPISLPPLRERLEDIPLLAEHFLKLHGHLAGGRVTSISPHIIGAMIAHPWRGNVRELENLIKRALLKPPGDTITQLELPGEGDDLLAPDEQPAGSTVDVPYRDYLRAIVLAAEERFLLRIMREQRGNINQIARLMDVDRKTVYRKLAEHSIDPDSYRS